MYQILSPSDFKSLNYLQFSYTDDIILLNLFSPVSAATKSRQVLTLPVREGGWGLG